MNLRNCGIFEELSDNEIKELHEISFEKSFKAGDTIFMEGDSSKYLHILLDGSVELVKANSKFGEYHLHFIAAPSMIAELPTFDMLPFPATCRAATDVKIVKIEFDTFKTKMLSRQNISYSFIKSLLQKIKILEGFIQKELCLSAEEKIVSMLADTPAIFEHKKHVDIAKILNITPETLSRTLRRLKEQGVVEFDGRRVYLLNAKGLKPS